MLTRRILLVALTTYAAVAAAQAVDEPPISTPVIAADNSPTAVAAAKEKGVANARRDIAAGRLRIVFLSETASIEGPTGHYDPETGYPHYPIAACEATEAFLAEVETYNDTMRKWHAEQKPRSASNQAMQRTASKAAIDVVRVCHPPVGCVAPCSGLAVADLVSR